MHRRQRPQAARQVGDGLKLHRRELRCDGRTYTVLTLRPGTDARFSDNYFHGTWHILSDWRGARLLGRLLWGLAYQRNAGTLVLLDRPNLDPNPFDAEPADPIALVPAQLTTLRPAAARALRRQLPLSDPPTGTVRWHTPGLDRELDDQEHRDVPPGGPLLPPQSRGCSRTRIDRVGGLLLFTASPALLRHYATVVYRLGERAERGMDYADIEWPAGEVQVFHDYRQRVNAARIARAEVRAQLAGPLPPADLNPLIWGRGDALRRNRRRSDAMRRRGERLRAPVPG